MKQQLDIIVPVFNEEQNIRPLCQRVAAVMEGQLSDLDWRLILVDDGSSDGSLSLIREMRASYPQVKLVALSRNFGHHQAIAAGLEAAEDGDLFLLMDGDLQDPPEEIPRLYEQLLAGNNLVYGIRAERHVGFFRKQLGMLFWSLIQKASGLPIPANQSILRIFDKHVYQAVMQFQETEKFYAGIFAFVGFEVAQIEIKRDARHSGVSKYNAGKLIGLTLTALSSFGDQIPRYLLILALWVFLISCAFLFLPFLGVLGLATSLILFWSGLLTSLLIACLSLLAMLQLKSFRQTTNRPGYLVKEKLGF